MTEPIDNIGSQRRILLQGRQGNAFELPFLEETASLSISPRDTASGPVYNNTLSAFIPGDDKEIGALLDKLHNDYYTAEVEDALGVTRLVGTPDFPISFLAQTSKPAQVSGQRGVQISGSCSTRKPPGYIVPLPAPDALLVVAGVGYAHIRVLNNTESLVLECFRSDTQISTTPHEVIDNAAGTGTVIYRLRFRQDSRVGPFTELSVTLPEQLLAFTLTKSSTLYVDGGGNKTLQIANLAPTVLDGEVTLMPGNYKLSGTSGICNIIEFGDASGLLLTAIDESLDVRNLRLPGLASTLPTGAYLRRSNVTLQLLLCSIAVVEQAMDAWLASLGSASVASCFLDTPEYSLTTAQGAKAVALAGKGVKAVRLIYVELSMI